jgi:sigma-E factor negative regulatory protein RseA
MKSEDELLSALVDDELSPAETARVLAALTADPARRETWARYQLIGTAIRRGVPDVVDPGLAARVQAAIGDSLPDAGDGLPDPALAAAGRPGWKRTAGGIAMAASVAAVALFGMRYLAVTEEGTTMATRVASTPVLQAQPVTVTDAEPPGSATLDQERLNTYLIRHNEFAATGGLRGLPPYVRVVGAETTGPVR